MSTLSSKAPGCIFHTSAYQIQIDTDTDDTDTSIREFMPTCESCKSANSTRLQLLSPLFRLRSVKSQTPLNPHLFCCGRRPGYRTVPAKAARQQRAGPTPSRLACALLERRGQEGQPPRPKESRVTTRGSFLQGTVSRCSGPGTPVHIIFILMSETNSWLD